MSDTIIDRTGAYYQRLAAAGFDPLEFYTRAERGRRMLAYWRAKWAPTRQVVEPENVVPLRRRRRKS